MAEFDDSRPLVWEDADRLSTAIDSILGDVIPEPTRFEAGTELEKRGEFQTLADDLLHVRAATARLLLDPDLTPEQRERAKAEYIELSGETAAEMVRRLQDWWPGFGRYERLH